MDTATIGIFFRDSRKRMGMTQQDVADRLHISPQAVSKWERGMSLPDISIFPELAELYGVSVSKLLSLGGVVEETTQSIIEALTNSVDEILFQKIYDAVEKAEGVEELALPLEPFMLLNQSQKSRLIPVLFDKEGYGGLVDDIIQYTNTPLREIMIRIILEKGDYEHLEPLVPFSNRAMRSVMVAHLLEDLAWDYIEGMLPFLNREQKDMIIGRLIDQEPELLENFMPFFDGKQQKRVHHALNNLNQEHILNQEENKNE